MDTNSELLVSNIDDGIGVHIGGGVNVNIRVDILDKLGNDSRLANGISQQANLHLSKGFHVSCLVLKGEREKVRGEGVIDTLMTLVSMAGSLTDLSASGAANLGPRSSPM